MPSAAPFAFWWLQPFRQDFPGMRKTRLDTPLRVLWLPMLLIVTQGWQDVNCLSFVYAKDRGAVDKLLGQKKTLCFNTVN